jgi:hypothetical protein
MALPKIVADYESSLATKIAVGETTGTIVSNVDDDGVTLADGTYYFTLDGNNSAKEHIKCTKTGTALSDIYSVSRQGVETSGVVREHRVGAKVIMTDYATYKNYFEAFVGDVDGPASNTDNNIPQWDGTDSKTLKNGLGLDIDLSSVSASDDTIPSAKATKTYTDTKIPKTDIDTDTTLAANSDTKVASQKATKTYVDTSISTGGVNASETAKGVVEEATQAEVAAGTATGGTGAKLFVTPAKLAAYSKPWTLLNSWTHSGDVASVTLNSLGGYSELLILSNGIGSSGTNNFKIITVSEDNGSTFLGANKYTNTDTGLFNGSSITITTDGSANVGSLIIHNATSSVIKFVSGGAGDSSGYIINSTSAINAIRLSIGNGGNITAGSLYVYGK